MSRQDQDKEKISVYTDASGRLKAKVEGKDEEYPVRPIRCFPLAEADRYLELFKIEPDGTIKEEIAFISDLKELDENSRKLIEEELDQTYPLTRIRKIHSAKQTVEALRWHVDTDKGERTFEVQEQKDIYALQPNLTVIKDTQGNRYQINSVELDPKSQALLKLYC